MPSFVAVLTPDTGATRNAVQKSPAITAKQGVERDGSAFEDDARLGLSQASPRCPPSEIMHNSAWSIIT